MLATDVLFAGKPIQGIAGNELGAVLADLPHAQAEWPKAGSYSVVTLAVEAGLFRTKAEAKRAADSGGLYVNNKRISGAKVSLGEESVLDGSFTVLRKGKKEYLVVKWQTCKPAGMP